MACMRWRGLRAPLLTTVYDNGRNRQVLLTNLQSGYTVPDEIRDQVHEQFPQITVKWDAIEEALARGPVGSLELTLEQWDGVRVERALRVWAENPQFVPGDANVLKAAAKVLVNRQAWISYHA